MLHRPAVDSLIVHEYDLSMSTVTIPVTQYETLKKKARAYEKLAGDFFRGILKGSIEEVVADFRSTELYSEKFLEDLESGLKKSSYTKQR